MKTNHILSKKKWLMQLLNLQLTFKLNSKFLFLSFQFNILWSMPIKFTFQLINWKWKLRIFRSPAVWQIKSEKNTDWATATECRTWCWFPDQSFSSAGQASDGCAGWVIDAGPSLPSLISLHRPQLQCISQMSPSSKRPRHSRDFPASLCPLLCCGQVTLITHRHQRVHRWSSGVCKSTAAHKQEVDYQQTWGLWHVVWSYCIFYDNEQRNIYIFTKMLI